MIGGGSTTTDGPKNEGKSLAVVTGVLRSPCAASPSWPAPLFVWLALLWESAPSLDPVPLSRIVIVGPPLKLFAIRLDALLSLALLLLLLLLLVSVAAVVECVAAAVVVVA